MRYSKFYGVQLGALASCVALQSAGLVSAEEAAPSAGGTSADELAKQLSNPVSSLISLPFQNNFDFGAGDDGWQYKLNVQPVIPFSLNDDWNLVARAIVPFVHQEDVIPDTEQTGISDTVASFFLSPAEPTDSGLIWGVGPVFLLPTATDDLLGTEKWGAGPTAVVLKQDGKYTYGALANHIWSFAGDDDRSEVSATFLQPFFVTALGEGANVALNSELTYDWNSERWTIPVNLQYNKVFQVGDQMMQWQVGGRYYLETPEGGPEWGIRVGLTLLFPK
ncbi:hypothetical protein SAMN02745181_3266 [Rubritalea squalenifaciens DSM 18772]|uniref:MetA-pathway of phenol degradation n=1 Tax=Rubritalea squalenifaciens DSM 18772 TaxID=1123071 RepID=A0A1M6PR04_9BACT|nr:hypothetical protein SAMN02745181_3266 [Rubritalea squalenifaciens DSM 18772]